MSFPPGFFELGDPPIRNAAGQPFGSLGNNPAGFCRFVLIFRQEWGVYLDPREKLRVFPRNCVYGGPLVANRFPMLSRILDTWAAMIPADKGGPYFVASEFVLCLPEGYPEGYRWPHRDFRWFATVDQQPTQKWALQMPAGIGPERLIRV